MRLLHLIILIVLFSCAHHDGPDRVPSSETVHLQYGEHDPQKSSVKEFPSQYEEPIMRHFYFVELKDSAGNYIDRDPSEFEVRIKKKILPVEIHRSLRGRYYVILEATKDLSTGSLDFYVANIKLRESFKLTLHPADPQFTTMKKIRVNKNSVKLELALRDKNGRFVEAPETPEIISENGVELTKIEHRGNGIWHITLSYPQGNQLFYVSVRSQGVYFKNLFRFQYVDN